MRHGEHGALVAMQELLEPQNRLGVEVVGGLVEQQQVGGLEQQAAQRHAATFTTGKHVHRHIGVRALQRVHGLGQLAVEIPAVGGVDGFLQLAHFFHERVEVGVGIGHFGGNRVEAFDFREHVAECHLHVLENGFVFVKRRLLLQNAHGIARGQACLAVGNLFETGHDLQQRGLAHAVRAHHADFRAGIERQRNVVENHLVAMRFARLVHGVNEFRHAGLLFVD